MNYSKTLLRFLPFLLLPFIFLALDIFSDKKVNNLIYIAAFVLLASMALLIFIKSRSRKNILKSGIKGVAKLISVEDTGVMVNFKPQLNLYLNVEIPNSTPYEVKHKEAVDNWNMTRLQAGAYFDVRVDPKNPKNLLIVWST